MIGIRTGRLQREVCAGDQSLKPWRAFHSKDVEHVLVDGRDIVLGDCFYASEIKGEVGMIARDAEGRRYANAAHDDIAREMRYGNVEIVLKGELRA